jgi:hypothetical protein
MPANDWNIRIVSTGSVAAAFQPRVPGGSPGGTLLARAGDLVTWGNAAHKTHQPWPVDASLNPIPPSNPPSATPGYICDAIAPPDPLHPEFQNSSQPQYIIDATLTPGSVVNYVCLTCWNLTPRVVERGSITISA